MYGEISYITWKTRIMQPAALKMPRKHCQTWPGQVDKHFQGRTKIFNIIAENFCPRIKSFGGDNFFLDSSEYPSNYSAGAVGRYVYSLNLLYVNLQLVLHARPRYRLEIISASARTVHRHDWDLMGALM